jgi:hypothetical protein
LNIAYSFQLGFSPKLGRLPLIWPRTPDQGLFA